MRLRVNGLSAVSWINAITKTTKMTGEANEQQHPIVEETHFEQLYRQHFTPLYRYAYNVVRDEAQAEGIVQNVFLKLWDKRDTLRIHTSWQAYLFRATYHEALNQAKRDQVRTRFAQQQHTPAAASQASDKELATHLERALLRLPEKCRTVFQLSRFENLKYQEIAQQLGISVKTVEAHMGKALKTLRVQLADFLSLLILLTCNQYL